jgi:UDP-N-acetylglucosamine:LPS N-acetylglucosamine transferase
MKKKNILILYAKMGKGHYSASMATKEAIMHEYKNKYNVEIVDFFGIFNETFSNSTAKAYDNTVKHMPNFYKIFFEWTDEEWKVKFINTINYLSLSIAFKKLLKKHNPDIIISTFPIWDYAIAKMWKKEHPGAKFINIITDSISIHKAWLIADADYRIVPNEDTAKVLIQKGVDPDKIKILGFPVNLTFTKEIDKKNVLKFLGLNPKLFTVLMFANIGNNRRNQKLLESIVLNKRDYNVIVVTGRNETLMPKIEHMKYEKNVAILGWTTNVPELILSSDIIVTKAGGATVMECVAAQKPMIITQVIPGQEEGNAELIEQHKLGIILEDGKKGITNLPDHIKSIRKDYNKYKAALKMQSKPEAALQIAKLIDSELS